MIPENLSRSVSGITGLAPTDQYVVIDTATGLADITVPNIATVALFDQRNNGQSLRSEAKIFIKNSGRNTCRLIAQDGNKINGSAFITLADGEAGELTIVSNTDWLWASTAGSSGGVVAGGQVYGIFNLPSAQIPSFVPMTPNLSRIPFGTLAPSVNIAHPNPFQVVISKSGLYEIDFQVFAQPVIDL